MKRCELAVIVSMLWVACGCEPSPMTGGLTPAPEKNEIVAQKAEAGVGKRGQKLQQHSDAQKIISGPANAYLQIKQKIPLEIEIPHALNLFKALEGRFPKSHEEFMEKIVAANNIQLPELPEGAVYRFNVEKGELWVYPADEAPNT